MEDQPRRPFFEFDTPVKYMLWLAALFLVPIVNTWLLYGGRITPEDITLSAYASLLLVNPIAVVIAGALYGWRHGFNALLPWLFGLAFIPAALVAYNPTALPYGIGYAVLGYVGLGIGIGLKRLATRSQNRSN